MRQAYYITHWRILSEIVRKLKIEKSIAAWKNDKCQSEIEIKWWWMFESSMAPKWPILISFWEWIIETRIFHWYLVPFLSRAVEVDDSRKLVDKTHNLSPLEHQTRDMKLKISICPSVRVGLYWTSPPVWKSRNLDCLETKQFPSRMPNF